MKEKQSASLVRSAETRAAITALLRQRTEPSPAIELAAALDIPPSTIGQYLAHMVKQGLIKVQLLNGLKHFSIDDTQPTTPTMTKTRTKHARDVELVVAGTLITIGRNPDTGRLRITLEETP